VEKSTAPPSYISRRPASARPSVGVLEIAADRETARQPRDPYASPQAVGHVGGGRLAGHVRVRREHDFLHAVAFDAADQLVDAEMFRFDAVERRERAAEDVVEPAELAGALDGQEVDRLLDDTDHGVVPAGVATDRADVLLRQVAALHAEADTLLDVFDRGGEGERLVLRPLQQVEREAVRRARADARKARQLGDELLHSRTEHCLIVPTWPGLPRSRSSRARGPGAGAATRGWRRRAGVSPGKVYTARESAATFRESSNLRPLLCNRKHNRLQFARSSFDRPQLST
jgi:hypothetical protein